MEVSREDKRRARSAVYIALTAGRLSRQPCEVCGRENVHAHHEDYRHALSVRWLCPAHHAAVHSQMREPKPGGRVEIASSMTGVGPSTLMTQSTDFRAEVETFLAETGTAPTTLGQRASGDKHFVRQMRKGRRSWPETIARVRLAMATIREEQSKKKDAA